jgi:hypothetical protein
LKNIVVKHKTLNSKKIGYIENNWLQPIIDFIRN